MAKLKHKIEISDSVLKQNITNQNMLQKNWKPLLVTF